MARRSSTQQRKQFRSIFSMPFMIGALGASVVAVMYGTGYFTGAFRRGSTVSVAQLCELKGPNVSSLTAPVMLARGFSPSRQMTYFYAFGRTVDTKGTVSSSFASERISGKPCDGLDFVTVKDMFTQSQMLKSFVKSNAAVFTFRNDAEIDNFVNNVNVEATVSSIRSSLENYFAGNRNDSNNDRFRAVVNSLDTIYLTGFGYKSGLAEELTTGVQYSPARKAELVNEVLVEILEGIRAEKVRQMLPPRENGGESGVVPLTAQVVSPDYNKRATSLSNLKRYVVYYHSVRGEVGSYIPTSVGVAIADVNKATNVTPVFTRYENIFNVSSNFSTVQISGYNGTTGHLLLWGTSLDGKSGMRYARVLIENVGDPAAYEYCSVSKNTQGVNTCTWSKNIADATPFRDGTFMNATASHDFDSATHIVLYQEESNYLAANIANGFILGQTGMPVTLQECGKELQCDYVRAVKRSYTKQRLITTFNYLLATRNDAKDAQKGSVFLNRAVVTEPEVSEESPEEFPEQQVLEIDNIE